MVVLLKRYILKQYYPFGTVYQQFPANYVNNEASSNQQNIHSYKYVFNIRA